MFIGGLRSIHLPHGVPQGFVLWTLLFLIYILPLGHLIQNHGLNFPYTHSLHSHQLFKCSEQLDGAEISETESGENRSQPHFHSWYSGQTLAHNYQSLVTSLPLLLKYKIWVGGSFSRSCVQVLYRHFVPFSRAWWTEAALPNTLHQGEELVRGVGGVLGVAVSSTCTSLAVDVL